MQPGKDGYFPGMGKIAHRHAKPRRLVILQCLGLLSLLIAGQGHAGSHSEKSASGGHETPASLEELRASLRVALANLQQADQAPEERMLLGIIDAAPFGRLEPSEQHAALAATAALAFALKHTQSARELATRATAMPEASVVDWEIRARASDALDDSADALICIVQLASRWRAALSDVPDALIERTAMDAAHRDLNDPLRTMLQALYDARWRLSDGSEPSAMWLELTRLLLKQSNNDAAVDVASHITSPYVLIGMRADNRYKDVLKNHFVQSDVKKAAAAQIAQATSAMQAAPRSLRRIVSLATDLRQSRRESEALTLTVATRARLETLSPAAAPYDDIARELPWIMNTEAQVLDQLGRYDDAIAKLRQAVAASQHTDHVSHKIYLAALLCRTNHAAEALAALPGDGDSLSPYGRMQLEKVRVMAATQLGQVEDAQRALDYLRAHERVSPSTLQAALLWAGLIDEASQLLISRLQDPALRTDALQDIQQYSEPPAPPRLLEWRARLNALRERSEVRRAIKEVGNVDRYELTRLGS
jgi:beta-barrel assembly-enhancing protease